MNVTNLFLALWYMDHYHEEGWWEHLSEMVELTGAQEEFLEGLPHSAAELMTQMSKNVGEMIPLFNQDYRRSLLVDEPVAQRKLISFEASLARERRRIVDEFLRKWGENVSTW